MNKKKPNNCIKHDVNYSNSCYVCEMENSMDIEEVIQAVEAYKVKKVPKCYKCGTVKELSKRGKTNFMCKTCRRADHKAYRDIKYVRKHKDSSFYEKTPREDWDKIAKEINNRILVKYA